MSSEECLIFKVAGQPIALPLPNVFELLSFRDVEVHRCGNSSPINAGMVRVRGSVLPVLDLRVMLGHPASRSLRGEVGTMLRQRKADHVRWIQTLEGCVESGAEFELARNPHQCAFGKWYDAIRKDEEQITLLTGGSLALTDVFDRMDGPHRRIHLLADEVLGLASNGHQEQAIARIQAVHDTDLHEIIEMFQKMENLLEAKHRDILILMEAAGCRFGIVVDAVVEVTSLSESDATETPPELGLGDQKRLLMPKMFATGEQTIPLLDAATLLSIAV